MNADTPLTADEIEEGLRACDKRKADPSDWPDFALHAADHYRRALRQLQRQAEELTRLRQSKCQQPTATACAREWETDHQGDALREAGLAEEFPFGCDAINYVVDALVAARAERDAARALAGRLAAALTRRHLHRLNCECLDPVCVETRQVLAEARAAGLPEG